MYAARILLYFVNFVFGLIASIIGLRIFFMLFNANPSTPFVSWIYEISRSLIYPFQGIFPSPVLQGGYILDISAIIALLVYAIIAFLVSELISFLHYRSTHYVVDGLEKTKVIHEE